MLCNENFWSVLDIPAMRYFKKFSLIVSLMGVLKDGKW